MLKVPTYSVKGTKLVETVLPKEFGEKPNLKFLAQAIRVYEERSHTGLAKTKTRAEVNRTKKKWYRQKGTGGARHGAKSAPIFVGGGVAHGPKPIRRELTLPKKMVKKALAQALSAKFVNKEIVVANGVEKFTKTREVKAFLDKIGKAKSYTFVLAERNLLKKRFLRNLPSVEIIPHQNLNAFNVFFGGMLIFDGEIFSKKERRARGKKLVPSEAGG